MKDYFHELFQHVDEAAQEFWRSSGLAKNPQKRGLELYFTHSWIGARVAFPYQCTTRLVDVWPSLTLAM